jgi:cytochrome c oxidase assembly protein subunit 15
MDPGAGRDNQVGPSAAAQPGVGQDRTLVKRVVGGAATAWRTVRHRQLSPARFRLASGLAVWSLAFIIVSGAAVRLTGSGLGCPDWPTCAANRVVAPWQYHAWVEFGNRLVTALVSIAVVVAVLGSLSRAPRRRDLIGLSLGLVGGVIAEIVLGGLTVQHHLAPGFVTAHFLLAVVFLGDAVILHHRAGLADEPLAGREGWARARGPAILMVAREQLWMSRLVLALAGVVVILGTVVTSTGPHGGDPTAPRFDLSLHDVAQLHGGAVELLLACTVVMLWSMSRGGVTKDVLRRGEVFLVVLVAQGGIGYLQYFTGVPSGLVELHVVGATAVVVAALHFHLGLTARPRASEAAALPHRPSSATDDAAGPAIVEPTGAPLAPTH